MGRQTSKSENLKYSVSQNCEYAERISSLELQLGSLHRELKKCKEKSEVLVVAKLKAIKEKEDALQREEKMQKERDVALEELNRLRRKYGEIPQGKMPRGRGRGRRGLRRVLPK